MKKVVFIRPPSASYYNDTHIREDHQITYAIGYAKAEKLGLEFKVFDFPLQRNITINDIISSQAKALKNSSDGFVIMEEHGEVFAGKNYYFANDLSNIISLCN